MFGIGRVCRDNQCLALVEFVEQPVFGRKGLSVPD